MPYRRDVVPGSRRSTNHTIAWQSPLPDEEGTERPLDVAAQQIQGQCEDSQHDSSDDLQRVVIELAVPYIAESSVTDRLELEPGGAREVGPIAYRGTFDDIGLSRL